MPTQRPCNALYMCAHVGVRPVVCVCACDAAPPPPRTESVSPPRCLTSAGACAQSWSTGSTPPCRLTSVCGRVFGPCPNSMPSGSRLQGRGCPAVVAAPVPPPVCGASLTCTPKTPLPPPPPLHLPHDCTHTWHWGTGLRCGTGLGEPLPVPTTLAGRGREGAWQHTQRPRCTHRQHP
jgi:hypothetical protein